VIGGYALAIVLPLGLAAAGVGVDGWWGIALVLIAVATAPLIAALTWTLHGNGCGPASR
jgi:hypothetical protein